MNLIQWQILLAQATTGPQSIGNKVKVAPFSDSYDAMKDIPVATCATMITTESGQDYLLIGNEMLWFGNTLNRSLLNPNQLRIHGIKVTDDPTVSDGFGIETEKLFLTLETQGTTVFFRSRAPTQTEINSPDIVAIELTSDDPWEPQLVQMRPHSQFGQSFWSRNINALGTSTLPIEIR